MITRAVKFSYVLVCWRKFYTVKFLSTNQNVRELDGPGDYCHRKKFQSWRGAKCIYIGSFNVLQSTFTITHKTHHLVAQRETRGIFLFQDISKSWLRTSQGGRVWYGKSRIMWVELVETLGSKVYRYLPWSLHTGLQMPPPPFLAHQMTFRLRLRAHGVA